LKQAQATADSSFQAKLVRDYWATPTRSGKFQKLAKGFEKFNNTN
jgi:hypothetical protein